MRGSRRDKDRDGIILTSVNHVGLFIRGRFRATVIDHDASHTIGHVPDIILVFMPVKCLDYSWISLGYCRLSKVTKDIVVITQNLAKKTAIIAVRDKFFHHDIEDFPHT